MVRTITVKTQSDMTDELGNLGMHVRCASGHGSAHSATGHGTLQTAKRIAKKLGGTITTDGDGVIEVKQGKQGN